MCSFTLLLNIILKFLAIQLTNRSEIMCINLFGITFSIRRINCKQSYSHLFKKLSTFLFRLNAGVSRSVINALIASYTKAS